MFGMGPFELLIIGLVALLLFGKRLPDVAKSVGKSWSEFQKAINNEE